MHDRRAMEEQQNPHAMHPCAYRSASRLERGSCG
jgi:hypothetical protein